MKHRILVLALSLAVLLVTAVPALAQEGAPTPPEGMMGITSVTTADTTSIGQPAGKAKGESNFTPIYGAAAVVILLGVFGAVRLRASKN